MRKNRKKVGSPGIRDGGWAEEKKRDKLGRGGEDRERPGGLVRCQRGKEKRPHHDARVKVHGAGKKKEKGHQQKKNRSERIRPPSRLD